eukprot:scaffold110142_cov26-Tisochrysis_lutea.AAC.1
MAATREGRCRVRGLRHPCGWHARSLVGCDWARAHCAPFGACQCFSFGLLRGWAGPKEASRCD